MKLKLLFIVMDMLTLLACPIVYMHNKIQRFLKSILNHNDKSARLALAADWHSSK